MHHAERLLEIVILLAAAVCMVALFRRMKLSPVLGFLVAGCLIGPYGVGFIDDIETTSAIAEFGVVFLLFVIGLELSIGRLIQMRKQVFGFGLAQVVITGLAVGLIAMTFGQTLAASIIIGGGLALSSSAIVLELISEGGEKVSSTGRLSLATLIMQDLAVIPLLVLVPLLAAQGSVMEAVGEASIKAVVGLIGIVLIGRLLLKPLFRYIAAHSHYELFTATTLLVVLGLSYISTIAGISAALGAFMGGLLIAETEFRPQVEADILPFKGMLLGLFFVTVGMTINLELVSNEALSLATIVGLIISIKVIIIAALTLAFRFPLGTALHTALLLAQGSEFGFVLFALARDQGIVAPETTNLLITAIAISMALTPFLHALGRKLEQVIERHKLLQKPTNSRDTADLHDHIIIAGYGRVGRIIAKLLEMEGIPYLALDMDATNVGYMRSLGKRVFYGDVSRSIVLRAVGLNRAQAIVVTHGDTRTSLQAISAVRSLGSHVPIIVRAKNVEQVMMLERAGATMAMAEMFETSLQLGSALLRKLGVADPEINRLLEAFRAEDYALSRHDDDLEVLPDKLTDFSI